MSVADIKEFSLLVGFAKAFATRKGDTTLQPRHFVAALWLAGRKGLLKAAPTLEAHIKAHGDAIAVLLREADFGDIESVCEPVSPDVKLTLDETLKAFITQANLKDDSLIEFVDQLVRPGLQLNNLESVAYHEAGHAVVSLLLRPEIRLGRATIEQEGNAAGSVSFVEREPRASQEDFLERLCIAIAGQVSQVRKFGAGAADAGAISDFRNATLVAWDYITRFGLDPQFGPVILDALKEREVTSGWIFDEAQRRLQAVLKEAQAKTAVIVDTHWDKVERVAQLLLEKKSVSEEEIRCVVIL